MFIPHTDADRAAMLRAVGIGTLEDLFYDVPEKHRFPVLTFHLRKRKWKYLQNCKKCPLPMRVFAIWRAFLEPGHITITSQLR